MLRNEPGIHSIKVALLAERAVVEYDPDVWTADKIMSVSAAICQGCPSALGGSHACPSVSSASAFVVQSLTFSILRLVLSNGPIAYSGRM